jgi:hypothetical protein
MLDTQRLFAPLDKEELGAYYDRLPQQGFEELGSGDYSTVYQHPQESSLVVKVAEVDEGKALEWLEWCRLNPSPYVPKVHEIIPISFPCAFQHITRTQLPCYLATMEKLEPVTKDEVEAFFMKNGLTKVMPLELPVDDNNMFWWSFIFETIHSVTDPIMREILRKIHELTNLTYCDLKPANFMRRGDQIVFTDPVPY